MLNPKHAQIFVDVKTIVDCYSYNKRGVASESFTPDPLGGVTEANNSLPPQNIIMNPVKFFLIHLGPETNARLFYRSERGPIEKCEKCGGKAKIIACIFLYSNPILLPNLFGEWTLYREWGRIGQGRQVRMEWFDSEDEAKSALTTMEAAKRRRGYWQRLEQLPMLLRMSSFLGM